jgi:hypothetical protein
MAHPPAAADLLEIFWYRALLACGKGPDWVFNAAFAPGGSTALAAMLREQPPAGFGLYRATQRPCSIHGGSCDYDLYVDMSNYQACVGQLEGRDASNIYLYHSIQVCHDEYQLVRGYGGYPDQHGLAETRSIRAIAQTPELILTKWSIVYGGMTYPYETLISGTTSAELLDYLDTPEGT